MQCALLEVRRTVDKMILRLRKLKYKEGLRLQLINVEQALTKLEDLLPGQTAGTTSDITECDITKTAGNIRMALGVLWEEAVLFKRMNKSLGGTGGSKKTRIRKLINRIQAAAGHGGFLVLKN